MKAIMTKTLGEMVGWNGRVVLVKPDGTFETAAYPPETLAEYAPETIYVDYSGDWDMPDILESHERDAIASVEGGWEVLTGWAHDGSLFIMRDDHGLSRTLEERILEEPGLWARVSVEMRPPQCNAEDGGMPCAEYDRRERCEHADYPPESKGVGWALVHREIAGTGD